MPGVAPGTIVTTASGHIPVETVTVGMLALAGTHPIVRPDMRPLISPVYAGNTSAHRTCGGPGSATGGAHHLRPVR